jgi:drug/metabolite transporter (DMT)-like permease
MQTSENTQIRRGILWMLLTVALFVSMDAIGKYLTQSYPVLQVTWARFFFHALWLIAFLHWRGDIISVIRTRRPALQLWRGFLMMAANTMFIAGVSVMPLVNTSSILLISPLLVTALSVPLLGEYVGPRRWAGVVIGCIGALIIIRPGSGVMQWAALFPLGAASCFAFYQIATRQLSHSEPPLTTLFYTISVGTPVMTLIMPLVWEMPDWQGWAMMAGMGLIGGISHFTLIKAFSAAPAAVISPFNYSNLVWATLFGFIVFGELPDGWTIVGALIIVASGLYVFFREQQRRTQS